MTRRQVRPPNRPTQYIHVPVGRPQPVPAPFAACCSHPAKAGRPVCGMLTRPSYGPRLCNAKKRRSQTTMTKKSNRHRTKLILFTWVDSLCMQIFTVSRQGTAKFCTEKKRRSQLYIRCVIQCCISRNIGSRQVSRGRCDLQWSLQVTDNGSIRDSIQDFLLLFDK